MTSILEAINFLPCQQAQFHKQRIHLLQILELVQVGVNRRLELEAMYCVFINCVVVGLCLLSTFDMYIVESNLKARFKWLLWYVSIWFKFSTVFSVSLKGNDISTSQWL